MTSTPAASPWSGLRPLSATERQELRRAATDAVMEAWDPWDWSSWSETDSDRMAAPEDEWVRLAPNVHRSNAALVIAASPDRLLRLLLERDELAQRLETALDALDGSR